MFSCFVSHVNHTTPHAQSLLLAILLLSPALPRHIISFDLCVSVPGLIPCQRTWARNKGLTHVAFYEQSSHGAFLYSDEYSSVGTVKPCCSVFTHSPLLSTPCSSPSAWSLCLLPHPFTAHLFPFLSSPWFNVAFLHTHYLLHALKFDLGPPTCHHPTAIAMVSQTFFSSSITGITIPPLILSPHPAPLLVHEQVTSTPFTPSDNLWSKEWCHFQRLSSFLPSKQLASKWWPMDVNTRHISCCVVIGFISIIWNPQKYMQSLQWNSLLPPLYCVTLALITPGITMYLYIHWYLGSKLITCPHMICVV